MGNQKDTVNSVEKALDILLIFEYEKEGLSLPEICDKLNLPKTTAYRLLMTLEKKGFIEKNEVTTKYQPGLKILSIGNILRQNNYIRQKAYPELCSLRDKSKETTNLFILKNKRRVCIESLEGAHMLVRHASIGDELPLYLGASGKALLAYQDELFIKQIIEEAYLHSKIYNSIQGKQLLRDELERIRRQGYACTTAEREIGLCSISAPIFNHNNNVIAVVTVSGPEERMKIKLDSLKNEVISCAKNISTKLGYAGE